MKQMGKKDSISRGARGFDWMSRVYDLLLFLFSFGLIRKSQTLLLDRIPDRNTERVFLPGIGTGSFAEDLLQKATIRTLILQDFSPRMLELCQNRLKDLTGVTVDYRCEDIFRPIQFEPVDLIFVNYLVDLFTEKEVGQLIDQWKSILRPGGLFFLTDFSPRPLPLFPRILRWFLLRLLYGSFRLVCRISGNHLAPYPEILQEAGFELLERKTLLMGVIESGVYRIRP